jgi:hypothetical protein
VRSANVQPNVFLRHEVELRVDITDEFILTARKRSKAKRIYTKPQTAKPRAASRALRFDQTQVRFNCAWLADVYLLKRRKQRIEKIV